MPGNEARVNPQTLLTTQTLNIAHTTVNKFKIHCYVATLLYMPHGWGLDQILWV